jgi:hypothetical protein
MDTSAILFAALDEEIREISSSIPDADDLPIKDLASRIIKVLRRRQQSSVHQGTIERRLHAIRGFPIPPRVTKPQNGHRVEEEEVVSETVFDSPDQIEPLPPEPVRNSANTENEVTLLEELRDVVIKYHDPSYHHIEREAQRLASEWEGLTEEFALNILRQLPKGSYELSDKIERGEVTLRITPGDRRFQDLHGQTPRH